MKYKPIEIGDKFGRLTVIKFDHKDSKYHAYWLCKCDCGNNTVVRIDNLRNGNTKSCGCVFNELICNRKAIAKKNKNPNDSKKGRKPYFRNYKKRNKYEILDDKIKVYTSKNKIFYISKESEWVLKDYCWCYIGKGYLMTTIKNNDKDKVLLLHNLIMNEYLEEEKEVDHIDGDKSNNCLSNLRVVTKIQNQWNKTRRKNYAISKIKGHVIRPYQVSIGYKKKRYYLGYYSTIEEARKVRDEWEDNHERKEYFRK